MDGRPNLRLCNVILDIQIMWFGPKTLHGVSSVKVHIVNEFKKNCFCWSWDPNLEQDSFCIFMKSMKISSISDSLPSVSQSEVDIEQIKNKFKEALGSLFW